MSEHELDALVDSVCAAAANERGDVRTVVTALADRFAPLATIAQRTIVADRAIARLDGLDALEVHLADPDVDEVMVNAGRDVWIDRRGALHHVGHLPDGVVDVVLERVLAPTGKRVDRTQPIVDVRLPDGARLCAAVERAVRSLGGTYARVLAAPPADMLRGALLPAGIVEPA